MMRSLASSSSSSIVRRGIVAQSSMRTISTASSFNMMMPRSTIVRRAAVSAASIRPRHLSTVSLVSSSSASSSISSPPVAVTAPSSVILIMAHYVGLECFSVAAIPSANASRAFRFTHPNSLVIPLETAGEEATGDAQSLNQLFTLPARSSNVQSSSSSSSSVVASSLPPAVLDPTSPFLVVFKYGAVVFFNVSESTQQHYLKRLRGASTKTITDKEGAKLKEDYRIQLLTSSPSSSSSTAAGDDFSCRFNVDSVSITNVDMNAVRILSQVLSQAVSMQHYELEANRLLIKLRAMLRPEVLHEGVSTLGHTRSDKIVRYVAESTTVSVEVLTELKLLDRSDIAWGAGAYDPLWTGLRREFDLVTRFEQLQTKLDLLRDSQPFFIGVVHQYQSHRMEIIIIALIAMEVVLSIVFHSPLIPTIKSAMGICDDETEGEGKKKAIKH